MRFGLTRSDHLVDQRLRRIEHRIARIQKQFERPRGSGTRTKIRDERFLAAARRVVDDGRTLLRHDRLWTLWQAARNAAPLQLPAAEVGSYRGGSAHFLAETLMDAVGRELPLDVIDTFAGHPDGRFSALDSPSHVAGLFGDTDVGDVTRYLSRFGDLRVHQGEFGAVKDSLDHPAYGLVHIDVDLYEATLDALRFFSARMPPGGVIVVDDFDAPKCPGVRRAVEDLLADDPAFQFWDALTEQAVLVRR